MPDDLATTVLHDYTQRSELVRDLFAGAATTLIEAVHPGRDATWVAYEAGWTAPASPS